MEAPRLTRDTRCLSGTAVHPASRSLQMALDVLTKETQSRLGDTGQTVFFLGDGIQRFAVDSTSELFNLQAWSPANILRLSSTVGRQLSNLLGLVTSTQATRLAWQELSNKIEVFTLVKNLNSILGLADNEFVPLPDLVQKAYSLPAFQALWGVEGVGNYYASVCWNLHGRPTGLLFERNAQVPKQSLLMLHAGMGLFFANHLLGFGSPTLIPESPSSQFRATVEEFVRLARDNARVGYLGPVVESLGLVTRDFYPEMVSSVHCALQQVAPEFAGFYWHGVGRALYFSRRYFLPVLSTVWAGVDEEAHPASERNNVMAGLTWAVVLVNMRQPEIMGGILRTYIDDSPLQDGFANGVTSSIIMRQETTPDEPFVSDFCRYTQPDAIVAPLWDRFIAASCHAGLSQYYPVLSRHDALGEVFRFQSLAALVARLTREPTHFGAMTSGGDAREPMTSQKGCD